MRESLQLELLYFEDVAYTVFCLFEFSEIDFPKNKAFL